MFQYSYSKLRVAYNDAFRQLLHEPRWCGASRLFVFHKVKSKNRPGHVQIAVDITAVDIDLFFLYCTGTMIMYDSFSL